VSHWSFGARESTVIIHIQSYPPDDTAAGQAWCPLSPLSLLSKEKKDSAAPNVDRQPPPKKAPDPWGVWDCGCGKMDLNTNLILLDLFLSRGLFCGFLFGTNEGLLCTVLETCTSSLPPPHYSLLNQHRLHLFP